MNTTKIPYDRLSVGERIFQRRKDLGYSQLELATMIDRSPKYYADIERGSCGMSIETLIALSECMDLSLDYIIFGTDKIPLPIKEDNPTAIINAHLGGLDSGRQECAMHIIKYFSMACRLSE